MGNTHRSIATFCIPSFIRENQNRGWHLVHLLLTVRGKITILTAWGFGIKEITILSTNNVAKDEWKC